MAITDINTETESGTEPGAAAREHLLQVMRRYLEQAESPQISLADFCALAGVSEAEFNTEFADIYSLQLLLVGELVSFDLMIRDALSHRSMLLDKAGQYTTHFWAHYSKQDFDQYERNLLRAGLLDYFQQTAESAAITRQFNRAHWCPWLQQAEKEEGLHTGISSEGLADFRGSLQNTIAIGTAFSGHSNRTDAFKLEALISAYLQRHLPHSPEQELAHV